MLKKRAPGEFSSYHVDEICMKEGDKRPPHPGTISRPTKSSVWCILKQRMEPRFLAAFLRLYQALVPVYERVHFLLFLQEQSWHYIFFQFFHYRENTDLGLRCLCCVPDLLVWTSQWPLPQIFLPRDEDQVRAGPCVPCSELPWHGEAGKHPPCPRKSTCHGFSQENSTQGVIGRKARCLLTKRVCVCVCVYASSRKRTLKFQNIWATGF